jgi:hypothetical protein
MGCIGPSPDFRLRPRLPESATFETSAAVERSGTGSGSSNAAGNDAHGSLAASAGTVSTHLDDPTNAGFWVRWHPETLNPTIDEESISALVALV